MAGSPTAPMLCTGGSGLLGRQLQRLFPDALFPSSEELDVARWESVERYAARHEIGLVVHAAALTSPPRVEADPLRALETNVVGTAHMVRLCMGLGCRLVYVSTDYVFRGDRGRYREEDAVHPVNKYAWSKLGGECAARLYDRSLIVRTSFGPDVFPHPAAFEDQWTSRECVSTFAEKLAELIARDVTGVVHVGGPRRTVLEYARSLGAAVDAISIHEVDFSVPVDTSLDCGRYDALVEGERGF